jgi:hypothetical protein
MGTTIEAMPMPTPRTMRPMMTTGIFGAAAMMIDPAMNAMSAMVSDRLRPCELAITPPMNAPNTAPMMALDTMKPAIHDVPLMSKLRFISNSPPFTIAVS